MFPVSPRAAPQFSGNLGKKGTFLHNISTEVGNRKKTFFSKPPKRMGGNKIICRPSKLSPTCHLPPLAPKRGLLSVGSQDSRPRHIFHGRRPSRPRTWGVARGADFPLQERELADAEEPNAAGTERITYERSWSGRESVKFDRLEWGSRRPDSSFFWSVYVDAPAPYLPPRSSLNRQGTFTPIP